ncbi:MAG TPA: PAS domain-containing protein [Alphaproteobacteria bacterium]|nr:PAS domain-containing protein [Alphaproteobacteria bacterium]
MVEQLFYPDSGLIKSARVQQLYTYWLRRYSEAGDIPARTQFDPVDLRGLLPNLFIVDVERNPQRFRYRLVGTAVVEYNQLEFTGRYLGSIGWEEEEALFAQYKRVLESGGPVFGYYDWILQSGAKGRAEYGLFPLADADGTIVQVIGVEDYDFAVTDARPTTKGG